MHSNQKEDEEDFRRFEMMHTSRIPDQIGIFSCDIASFFVALFIGHLHDCVHNGWIIQLAVVNRFDVANRFGKLPSGRSIQITTRVFPLLHFHWKWFNRVEYSQYYYQHLERQSKYNYSGFNGCLRILNVISFWSFHFVFF